MKLNNYFFPFLFFLLCACKTPYVPVSNTQSLYLIKDSIASDTVSAIEAILKPYRDSLSGIMNEVIGLADGDFRKEKNGGSLGNLITDAMFEEANKRNKLCIGAIFNPGGIRLPDLMKGNITKGKMLELLPFDNELVIMELKGDVLEKWLNVIGEKGGWPTLFKTKFGKNLLARSIAFKNKQIDYSFSDTTYVENVVDGSITMNVSTTNLEKDSTYYIATNDYIANGGDNCDFLKDQKRINTGIFIRNIVSEYIKSKKTIVPNNEKRIQFND